MQPPPPRQRQLLLVSRQLGARAPIAATAVGRAARADRAPAQICRRGDRAAGPEGPPAHTAPPARARIALPHAPGRRARRAGGCRRDGRRDCGRACLLPVAAATPT